MSEQESKAVITKVVFDANIIPSKAVAGFADALKEELGDNLKAAFMTGVLIAPTGKIEDVLELPLNEDPLYLNPSRYPEGEYRLELVRCDVDLISPDDEDARPLTALVGMIVNNETARKWITRPITFGELIGSTFEEAFDLGSHVPQEAEGVIARQDAMGTLLAPVLKDHFGRFFQGSDEAFTKIGDKLAELCAEEIEAYALIAVANELSASSGAHETGTSWDPPSPTLN